MEQYTRKVSGIYPDQTTAEQAVKKLRENGFPENQLRVINPHDPDPGAKLEPEGVEVAKEIGKDTMIGAGAGGVLGIVGSAALGVAEVALFVTTPILGTLMIATYAATVGGVAGYIKGLKIKETAFLGIVEDALKQGHWVVLALAHDKKEEDLARKLIADTAAEGEAEI